MYIEKIMNWVEELPVKFIANHLLNFSTKLVKLKYDAKSINWTFKDIRKVYSDRDRKVANATFDMPYE